jgi:hypothetical protein
MIAGSPQAMNTTVVMLTAISAIIRHVFLVDMKVLRVFKQSHMREIWASISSIDESIDLDLTYLI